MSRIVIENISPSDGESVSLVEQFEALLEEIGRKAQKLMRNGEASAFDRWLRNERDRFWAQQVELVEHEQSFQIWMAVPSPGPIQLDVSPNGIEVRRGAGAGNGEDPGSGDRAGELIRQVPLSGLVDARSVTATLGRGELRLAGPWRAKVSLSVLRADPARTDSPRARSRRTRGGTILHVMACSCDERRLARRYWIFPGQRDED